MAEPDRTEGVKETHIPDEKEFYEIVVKENLFYDHYMESVVFTNEGNGYTDIFMHSYRF